MKNPGKVKKNYQTYKNSQCRYVVVLQFWVATDVFNYTVFIKDAHYYGLTGIAPDGAVE